MSAVVLAKVSDRLRPVSGSFREGRFIARVTCQLCAGHDEWTAMSMPQPEVVKKKLQARGWQIDRRATCPACLTKSKENAPMKQTPAPKPAPSFDAKAALRLLSRVLDDEAYDHANQRYKPGFSDASLSKDTGLDVKVVASERERLCGPVGEPVEVTAFRADLEAAIRAAKLALAEADNMKLRLDEICARHKF